MIVTSSSDPGQGPRFDRGTVTASGAEIKSLSICPNGGNGTKMAVYIIMKRQQFPVIVIRCFTIQLLQFLNGNYIN